MTVCVGAICSVGREGDAEGGVVVASDRMVTLGRLTEFEHGVPKVSPVAERVVALIAGDALRGSLLVRDLAARVNASTLQVSTVAELLGQCYTERRLQMVQDTVFGPKGLDLGEFYAGGQQRLVPQIAGSLHKETSEFNYGVEILLAGTDDTGGHLFYVGNPGGSVVDFEQIGFHAIGTGALHALQSMIGFKHTGAQSAHLAAFNVYVSKRRAEIAPGVGEDTDLWIVSRHDLIRFQPEHLAQFDSLYQEFYCQPIVDGLLDRLNCLDVPTRGEPGEHE